MSRIILNVFLLTALLLSKEVEARENIRVLIMVDIPSVTVESPWGFDFPQGLNSSSITVDKEEIRSNPFRITPVGDYLILNGKRYRGSIEVRKDEKGLYVINDLNIEDYLKGVVPQEIDHKWDMEAIKAQAIVARTYALYYIKENSVKEYDLDSSIMSQVYSGMDSERSRTTLAVIETEGIILTYEGKVIEAYYHASCGGHTENSGDVWSKDAPYLRGVECPETSQPWEKRITLGEIESALRKDGMTIGRVVRVEISSTTDTGRVSYLKIHLKNGGLSEPLYIRANDFRRIFGYTRIPSTNFRIEGNGDEIKLSGRGAGHGVGFCQFGAKELSERGKVFKEILKHYYKGIEIGNLGDL